MADEQTTTKTSKTSTSAQPSSAETKTTDSGSKSGSDLSIAEQSAVNALPTAGTVEDPAGVERVVVPNIETSWKPAQVDPDKDEVARLERLQSALDGKKQERLDALKVS